MVTADSLRDAVVVVTGAGGGIGAATARALLQAGARVVAGDLRPEPLADLREQWGDQVAIGVGDVGDPATADTLVATAVQTWGRLDAVVANAGVGHFGALEEISPEQIERMTSTNFLGTVWLARSALRQYRAAERPGDLVIMASVAGLGVGGGLESVYAATKAAQIQFATSLAREVRAEGIRVSVIAPAAVNTHFAVATGRFGDRAPEEGDFIEPDDLGAAVVTALQQPRRIRTALWTIWSLAEAD
jgi:NAD(P)-dependent dehydrogenase (short-subunit alcohol dehydrogenase family)